MKKIIFGRDHQANQLWISFEGKASKFGDKNSVPTSVGKEHVSLTIDDDGELTLENLDIENDTYVNGIGIERKRIKKGDRIQLGKDRYPLKWDVIDPFIPQYVDIRPLKAVWDNYKECQKEIQIRQKNNGLLASVPMVFSMIGGLLSSVVPPEIRPYTMVLTGIAVVIMLVGLYRRFTDNSIEERAKLDEDFQHEYVCPNCGHFMSNQSYHIISQGTCCPYCKAIYKK